jgi:hypothetical protein
MKKERNKALPIRPNYFRRPTSIHLEPASATLYENDWWDPLVGLLVSHAHLLSTIAQPPGTRPPLSTLTAGEIPLRREYLIKRPYSFIYSTRNPQQ